MIGNDSLRVRTEKGGPPFSFLSQPAPAFDPREDGWQQRNQQNQRLASVFGHGLMSVRQLMGYLNVGALPVGDGNAIDKHRYVVDPQRDQV